MFSILLDLLQMLIVTVLREPGNDITLRPIYLERVLVLVVDVVLRKNQ